MSQDHLTATRVMITRKNGCEDLPLPAYQTAGSAGLDLCAAVTAPFVLAAGARALIPTGMSIALPEGFEAQVRPRSGMALKHGISIVNTPGTVDSDYRGELQIILVNLGTESFTITRGMRIAQMVIARFERVELVEVEELPESGRGSGGFGHTGH